MSEQVPISCFYVSMYSYESYLHCSALSFSLLRPIQNPRKLEHDKSRRLERPVGQDGRKKTIAHIGCTCTKHACTLALKELHVARFLFSPNFWQTSFFLPLRSSALKLSRKKNRQLPKFQTISAEKGNKKSNSPSLPSPPRTRVYIRSLMALKSRICPFVMRVGFSSRCLGCLNSKNPLSGTGSSS